MHVHHIRQENMQHECQLVLDGRDKYLRMAGVQADSAKIVYRNQLKTQLRQREQAALRSGQPMSSRVKQRERSRTESWLYRRRAQVYVQHLEATARKLSTVEQELRKARVEVARMRREVALLQKLEGSGREKRSNPEDGTNTNRRNNNTVSTNDVGYVNNEVIRPQTEQLGTKDTNNPKKGNNFDKS